MIFRALVFLVCALLLSPFLKGQEQLITIECPAPKTPMLRAYWHSAALVKAELIKEGKGFRFKPHYIYRDTLKLLSTLKSYPLLIKDSLEQAYVAEHFKAEHTYRMLLTYEKGQFLLDDDLANSFLKGKSQLLLKFDGTTHLIIKDFYLKEFLDSYDLYLIPVPRFDLESKRGQNLIATNPLIEAFEKAGRNYYESREEIIEIPEPEVEEEERFTQAIPLNAEACLAGGNDAFRELLKSVPRNAKADDMQYETRGVFKLYFNHKSELIKADTLRSMGFLNPEILNYIRQFPWQIEGAKGDEVYTITIPFPYRQ